MAPTLSSCRIAYFNLTCQIIYISLQRSQFWENPLCSWLHLVVQTNITGKTFTEIWPSLSLLISLYYSLEFPNLLTLEMFYFVDCIKTKEVVQVEFKVIDSIDNSTKLFPVPGRPSTSPAPHPASAQPPLKSSPIRAATTSSYASPWRSQRGSKRRRSFGDGRKRRSYSELSACHSWRSEGAAEGLIRLREVGSGEKRLFRRKGHN